MPGRPAPTTSPRRSATASRPRAGKYSAEARARIEQRRMEVNEAMARIFDPVDGVDLVITASNPDVAFAADGPLPDTFGGIEAGAGQQRQAHLPRQPPRQPGDLDPGRPARRPPGRAPGRRPPLHRAAAARAGAYRRTQPTLAPGRARTVRSYHMKVPLTVNDFLRRAELLYPDRIGIVDEPNQPAESWGSLTYREVAERARAIAAGLDELGIGAGRAGGDGHPQLGPPDHGPVRRVGLGPDPRPRQLPAGGGRGELHRRALRVTDAARRPRARRRPRRGEVRAAVRDRGRKPTRRSSATASSLHHGPATRTPRRRSTTRRGPPLGPRASRSPTATSGSTRPRSAGTSA